MRDLWYVATPYTHFAEGIEKAFQHASLAAAILLTRGYAVFSPIAHSHPIAIHGGLDPIDHTLWLEADKQFMDLCTGLMVIQMPGWEESYGVSVEILTFRDAGKPIRYYSWPEMEMVAQR